MSNAANLKRVRESVKGGQKKLISGNSDDILTSSRQSPRRPNSEVVNVDEASSSKVVPKRVYQRKEKLLPIAGASQESPSTIEKVSLFFLSLLLLSSGV